MKKMKSLSKQAKLRKQGSPVLPIGKQKNEPIRQAPVRKAALVDNARRYSQIAKAIAPAVKKFLQDTPKERISTNALTANKNQYNYDVDPIPLSQIIRFMGETLDLYLSINPNLLLDPNFWLSLYAQRSYKKGLDDTLQSLKNISTADNVGQEESQSIRQMDAEQIVADPTYQRRVGLVKGRVFENMKGLSQQTKADLADTLARGMTNGLGVTDITREIVARIGVSKRRAETIARTEINGAYRTSTRQETRALNDALFSDFEYEMKMLWISALSPTTRETHSRRHGSTYTVEEIAAFYSVDGNAINCLCSQVPVFVNKSTGEVLQSEVVEQLKAEKKKFKALSNNSYKSCGCC